VVLLRGIRYSEALEALKDRLLKGSQKNRGFKRAINDKSLDGKPSLLTKSSQEVDAL
jgi:hypothetical protein